MEKRCVSKTVGTWRPFVVLVLRALQAEQSWDSEALLAAEHHAQLYAEGKLGKTCRQTARTLVPRQEPRAHEKRGEEDQAASVEESSDVDRSGEQHSAPSSAPLHPSGAQSGPEVSPVAQSSAACGQSSAEEGPTDVEEDHATTPQERLCIMEGGNAEQDIRDQAHQLLLLVEKCKRSCQQALCSQSHDACTTQCDALPDQLSTEDEPAPPKAEQSTGDATLSHPSIDEPAEAMNDTLDIQPAQDSNVHLDDAQDFECPGGGERCSDNGAPFLKPPKRPRTISNLLMSTDERLKRMLAPPTKRLQVGKENHVSSTAESEQGRQPRHFAAGRLQKH